MIIAYQKARRPASERTAAEAATAKELSVQRLTVADENEA
jgi:hypothetical protein